ncbi:MAG: protein kinase [Sandaracinaceae bacterium]
MSDSPLSLQGRVVDRYEIHEEIGRGGFGAVYRARHQVIGSSVALKVLAPEHAREEREVARFMREARAAAAIGHPNIARVFDAGQTDDGLVFLAMELLDGENLEVLRRARGTYDAESAVRIMGAVLDALGAAHTAGVLHRDLKPGNVFVTRDGKVKLLDFGISKIAGERNLTATGLVVGTPQYMAPEQLEGRVELDGRADLYAAATVFYELVSGRLPFPGQGLDVIVRRLRGERAPTLREVAPKVTPSLSDVIERGLALDRDARFADAASLKRALEEAAQGRAAAIGDQGHTVARPSPLAGVPIDIGNASTIAPAMPKVSRSDGPAPARTSRGAIATQALASAPELRTPSMRRASIPATLPPRTDSAPPPAASASASVSAWVIAAFALAILVAGAVGVVAVLVYRLRSAPLDSSPVAGEHLIEPSGAGPPLRDAATPPPDPSTPALRPEDVQYQIVTYAGVGRPMFEALLERARPDVAACAIPHRTVHVALHVVISWGGDISVVTLAQSRRNDDYPTSRCVGEAIRRHGPIAFQHLESAVADLDADLAAN